jgi:hypothetical protein
MIKNFDDRCFILGGSYDFVRIADKYLDSVKIDTPVSGIIFVKSFDFAPHFDGRDTKPLHENTVLDIDYDEATWGNKVPEIESVGYWVNGERKGLNYLEVSSRKRVMRYYDSQKQK